MPIRQKTNSRKDPGSGKPADTGEGFYHSSFTPREVEDLAGLDAQALDDEINMLRVSTRRVFEIAKGVQELQQSIDALRALGMAATRLSVLLRSQTEVQQQANQAIQSALNEVLQEMKLI